MRERILASAAAAAYTRRMWSRYLLLTLLLALLGSPLPGWAQADVSPADADAIRRVIEAQIAAFRQDDAERAFALATPGIRATFGTAQKFLEMVRTSYAVVYRPRTVAFDAPVLADGEVVQAVRMTDAEGQAWIALYPMRKQPDGSWKTAGCQLWRVAGRET